MIPKKLHLVWFSKNNAPLPPLSQLCVDSWRRQCPDYEIVNWGMEKCKDIIESVPYLREAASVSKWAFISDYIRLYAVYHEGGIYCDTDVFMFQNFDPFLNNRYFTNVEYTSHFKKNRSWKFLNEDGTKKDPNQVIIPGMALQAAIFGAEPNHSFVKSCMEYYETQKFILPDGQLNIQNISPHVYAHAAQKYGFRYKNEMQNLEDGVTIYSGDVFLPSLNPSKKKPFAVHVTNGSWRPLMQRIVRFLKNAPRGTIEDRLKEYEGKDPITI